MSKRLNSYWAVYLALAIQLGWAGCANAQSQTPVQPLAASDQGAPELQEVIVTAEKRTEVAANVPMALTVLSGAQLARLQSYQLQDYVGTIPGLTLIASGAAQNSLVIRGLSTGDTVINSQVATYIDDTPYTLFGPFTGGTFGGPNLDTFDLQRIEVLKGPQGTLYGANALGGLLKFVTNAPDPSAFAATVESGVNSVDNGGIGGDVHAMVNIPLANDMALRLVGYDNDYSGFIDDPSRDLKGINGSHDVGGRASLLYEPTSGFSIRFNALYQDRSWSDVPDEDVNPNMTPVYGNLIQERLISQPGEGVSQLYNVTIHWDVGFAELISTTSYIKDLVKTVQDRSGDFGQLITAIFGPPSYGVAIEQGTHSHAVTQEVRLQSHDRGALQWQVGGYFTSQGGYNPQVALPIQGNTILVPDPLDLGGFFPHVTYKEYAGYANLDYHLTQTFDVGVGGRYTENKQNLAMVGSGLFGTGSDFTRAESQGVSTWSGDARWHMTPQTMLYARVATGYTPGGPNDVGGSEIASGISPTYSSSTDVNYEVGIKNSLLDHRLTADVDAYYITWRNIQLNLVINGLGFTGDGGAAHSKGVEWNFAYVPVRGLTLDFNGSYDDAYITEAGLGSGDAVGDRLPGISPWEMSASAEYEWPLMGNLSAFAQVDGRYSARRSSDFELGSPRPIMPSFSIFDLRGGVESDRWSLAVYVKNLGNKIAIDYVTATTKAEGYGPQSANVYTPRTVGMTGTWKF